MQASCLRPLGFVTPVAPGPLPEHYLPPMGDSSSSKCARPARRSGGFTVHLADGLEVSFSEVKDGRPVGFVASPKWRPPTDVFETADAMVIYMDVAGLKREDFEV